MIVDHFSCCHFAAFTFVIEKFIRESGVLTGCEWLWSLEAACVLYEFELGRVFTNGKPILKFIFCFRTVHEIARCGLIDIPFSFCIIFSRCDLTVFSTILTNFACTTRWMGCRLLLTDFFLWKFSFRIPFRLCIWFIVSYVNIIVNINIQWDVTVNLFWLVEFRVSIDCILIWLWIGCSLNLIRFYVCKYKTNLFELFGVKRILLFLLALVFS